MSEGTKIERFEKKVLFNIVRWFGLLMGFLGLVAFVIGVMALVQSLPALTGKTQVEIGIKDVEQSLHEKKAGDDNPDAHEADPEKRPKSEADRLIGEIIAMLVKDSPGASAGKIEEILYKLNPNMEEPEKVAYFKAMKDIVVQAPAGKKAEYVDGFVQLHQKKLIEETAKAEARKAEAARDTAVSAFMTAIGLITLVSFGIILVLLAIERNTRRREEAAYHCGNKTS